MIGETEVLGENLPQFWFVHNKSYMNITGLETGPPRCAASDHPSELLHGRYAGMLTAGIRDVVIKELWRGKYRVSSVYYGSVSLSFVGPSTLSLEICSHVTSLRAESFCKRTTDGATSWRVKAPVSHNFIRKLGTISHRMVSSGLLRPGISSQRTSVASCSLCCS
jgi:hypothetical protein